MATRLRARPLGFLALAALLAWAAVAGCGIGAARSPRVTAPTAPVGPATTSAAVALARAALVEALGTVNLILADPRVPYRPAESPSLIRAPRQVYQVVLPDDPGHGFITVYEFATEPEAAAAADEQGVYVTSGPGRVQFPPDAQFVLRRVERAVVFHVYSRENSTDRRAADIVAALQLVGDPVAVPR